MAGKTDHGELGVLSWDGSGKRVLDTIGGWNGTEGEVVQLSYDGSKLNYGSRNRLYNTDGSGVLQLAAYGATLTGDPPLMVGWGDGGFYRSSMSRDARRFLFYLRPWGLCKRRAGASAIGPSGAEPGQPGPGARPDGSQDRAALRGDRGLEDQHQRPYEHSQHARPHQ